MNALITGSGGFIGSSVNERLRALGWEVATMGRSARPGRHHRLDPVTDERQVAEVLAAERPDVIFHVAGTAKGGSLQECYGANVFYAAALLGAVRQVIPRTRVVLLGSAAEYGDQGREPVKETAPTAPVTSYGISKLAQTLHGLQAARAGLNVTICRLFNVVGPEMPRHLALGAWAARIREARSDAGRTRLQVGNLSNWRDFVDVRDVVEVLIRLAQLPAAAGEIVNVGSGRAEQMEVLLQRLIRLSGLAIDVEVGPAPSTPDIAYIVSCPKKLRELTGVDPRGITDELLVRCLAERAAGGGSRLP
jgi:nucleoside-diphosphate-sugar epimerase